VPLYQPVGNQGSREKKKVVLVKNSSELSCLSGVYDWQGVEPSIRTEVWKFLLGYYDWTSTYKTRTELRKKKV